MKILVAGASGATGRLLVQELLNRGMAVTAVIRAGSKLPDAIIHHENLTVVYGNILDYSGAEVTQLVEGCRAIASCLGHNISLTGLFGHPRRLVTDTVRRLCEAVKAGKPEQPVKFVLMNTTGNQNRDLSEPATMPHKFVLTLLRLLLPPHVDNEQAADYLRTQIGQKDSTIEWSAVRPCSLVDEPEVTEYEEYPSPTRDPIFDSGCTSRINVAHFMAELMTNPDKWDTWKGRMPVIYNQGKS